jgi:hypothetical protein
MIMHRVRDGSSGPSHAAAPGRGQVSHRVRGTMAGTGIEHCKSGIKTP